jgi:hypothetical protein
MDIAVINSVGVHKRFYEFPSDVAAALIHVGLAVQISKPTTAPAKKPHWYVGEKPVQGNTPWNGDYVLIWTDGNGAIMYFTGAPEAYLQRPPVHCGLEAPLAVLEQYARLVGVKGDPDVFNEQMQRRKDAAAVQRQREASATAQYGRG